MITDKQAMTILADWMETNDPTIKDSDSAWVWDLVDLVDYLLEDTGRSVNAD